MAPPRKGRGLGRFTPNAEICVSYEAHGRARAVRRAMPSGTTPVVTKRHSAISSLRARATIIFLRVFAALSVRATVPFR